jgi:hypothetical protein
MSDSAGGLGIDDFMRLETSVWEALMGGDADADGRLLSTDFVGLYPTGFAGREDHVGQLSNGPTVAEFRLTEERLLVLSDTAVVLAYRAEYLRAGRASTSEHEAMYVSSIWCRRDGEWVNVFSQDTPASGEAVP